MVTEICQSEDNILQPGSIITKLMNKFIWRRNESYSSEIFVPILSDEHDVLHLEIQTYSIMHGSLDTLHA